MAEGQLLWDYHIGEGGPLRRFEAAAHLTNLHSQIAWVLVLTWVPIVLLGVVGEVVTGQPEPLLRNPAVHVRLLVGAPVFLLLDRLFPPLCQSMLAQLFGKSFIPEAAKPSFDRLLRSTARLADSPLPEVLLGLLSLCFGLAALFGIIPVSGLGYRKGLTLAQGWFALTDVPTFQFLLLRSLWRWAIWVRILVGLSRIDLDLVPTHPDRRGGIGFLRIPSVDYCAMLLFAISSVVCAELWGRFTVGSTLNTFKPLLLLFAVVGAIIAFGPLLLFAPKLVRTRRKGLFEVGGLAAEQGRRFNARWLGRIGSSEEPATSADRSDDTQALAALGQTFREEVNRVSWLMIEKRDFIPLLIATLLPVVAVALLNVAATDWMELLRLLTGGRF